MMFCPVCGAVLKVKNGKVVCSKNENHEVPQERKSMRIKSKINKKEDDIVVIKDEIQTLPTTKAICKKCGNKIAYYWIRQTRAADEPETKFFRCTKCGYTWREYG